MEERRYHKEKRVLRSEKRCRRTRKAKPKEQVVRQEWATKGALLEKELSQESQKGVEADNAQILKENQGHPPVLS